MKNIFLFICVFSSVMLSAQNIYNYANIPDELKKNANYIIWEDFKEFEVLDIGRAVEKVKFAVCIVDQYSKAFNSIEAHYGKFEKISGFKAEIFDKDGNSVKKLKSSEIQDVSAVSSFALFQDDRVLYAEFIYAQYPYTLVYEYERKVEGLLHYPTWYFQKRNNTGVISSQINIIVPKELKFRFKEYNLKNTATITIVDKKEKYTWTEKNLLPDEPVELSPPENDYEPVLMLAPIQFGQGGYKGNMDSWNNFGIWDWELNKDRDILSEEKIKELRELVKDAKTDKEKAKILYKYMQNKTRYVLVALGIGGYQPFTADFVDSKGYGDCKALSNYMYSLLKAVGIKSYYTLVFAGEGEDDILTDFPSSQFNHVILCMPQEKDTVWMECTDQQQPFNFLGSFTDDRHVLLVSENGGKLVKTPKYTKDVNTQNRKASLKLSADGNAIGKVNTVFSGLRYEKRDGFSVISAKEQKDALKKIYPVGGLEISNFKFTENKEEIPNIVEDLDVNIQGFAPLTGKRMFIKLNVFNETSDVPKNEERKLPFQLRSEYSDVDTVQFEIPEGYNIESIPQAVNLKTKFGSYFSQTIQEGNKIIYMRKENIDKAIYPAADYAAFIDYCKQVVKADKAKLVLVKKI